MSSWSKNETSTAEAEIVLSHVISCYLISNYQNILTTGNEMNLSSSNFTNSAKYLIKTKIKSIFYKLPTNKYATTRRRRNIWLCNTLPLVVFRRGGAGKSLSSFSGSLRRLLMHQEASRMSLLWLRSVKSWNRLQSSRLRLNRRSARLRGISILYWKISISRPGPGLTF